ncbi:MAG TPA: N-acetylmuramoyl-L-alanine amidase, partial [Synechococcales bacterium UBA8647]|nr:N-acetylmuramoyl-L-alanine amidase [Synechococcales bacterium UBA8647]
MFEARRWASSLMAGVLAAQLIPVLPARAFSRLAAWAITAKGELLLRTSPNLDLDAFFKDGDGRYGDRIWIDFPGSPQRPRKIPGKGAVREIRVGMPERGVTRLVIEFKRGVELDPSKLRLVGLDWDSWRMRFPLQDAR